MYPKSLNLPRGSDKELASLPALDAISESLLAPLPIIVSKLVFWVLLVAGVIGIIASVFMPALASILGSIFGLCALIGAAGLIVQHKGHSQTRTDEFDDGARV